MTEYRIVATIDTVDRFGKKEHRENACPVHHRTFHKLVTKDKKTAEKWLSDTIEFCGEHDRKTQKSNDPWNIKYTQTNIRIQTREVTDWADQ